MITVLMATYNGSSFIVKQLESIRKQTVRANRVIILDDCSTDNTFEIVNKFIEQYSLTNWTNCRNTFNKGHYQTFIELTTMVEEGYVFFSDQDDIWDNNKIEIMIKELIKSDVSMVFCKSRFINECDEVISKPAITGEHHSFSVKRLLQAWPSGYQTAFKAEVLKTIITNRYHKHPYFQFHDVLFGMLSGIFGNVIEVDEILDSHRLHLNNVTLSSKSVSFHNTLENRLDYYIKMYKRYEFVNHVSQMFGVDEAEKVSKSYGELYKSRISFIEKRNIKSIREIYRLRHYYNGYRAFISDIIYALRLNNLFSRLIRR
ncbi:glycosyltransferase [Streptococcus ruminantium]|uniref:glycosyltransferase n=1 Tax=Streptococcus ruminantium TaxID=1917441 RepID=UPI0012DFD674|nr:glycosyltransferase [Streptococcus ruminantium]